MNKSFNQKDARDQGLGHGQEMVLILLSLRARAPTGISVNNRSLYKGRCPPPSLSVNSQVTLTEENQFKERKGRASFLLFRWGGEDDGLLVKEQGVGLYSDPTPIYLFVYHSITPLLNGGKYRHNLFFNDNNKKPCYVFN